MADDFQPDKNSRFAIAWGKHPVKGYKLDRKVVLVGNNKEIVYKMGLGLDEWDACEGLYYRGNPIAPADFAFHSGSPVDTADSFFPGETYPGAAYVNVRLRGAFAEEDNPDNIEGVYRCLKIANYNGAGQQIDGAGNPIPGGATPRDYYTYSPSPAREMVDLIIRWGLRRATIVNWPGWADWRDDCAQLITWNDGTSVRQIPRFESHLFFIPPFLLKSGMGKIAEVSCAEWERASGKLYFLTPHSRDPIFTFDLTKMPLGAFRTFAADRSKKFNQVLIYFRDLDTPNLTPAGEDGAAPIVDIKRPLGVNEVRKPLEINIGGAYASQAQRDGEYYARINCDLDQVAEFEGSPDSYPVLPNSVVELSDVLPTWNGVKFKIFEKEESEDTKLGYPMTGLIYAPSYSDTDHGPITRPLPPANPDEFAAPPQATSVTLSENNVLQADQTVVTFLRVEAQFAPYVNKQKGRVYYKKSTEADNLYRDAGTIDPDISTLQGALEIRGVEKITYNVKVVPESSFASAGIAGATASSLLVTGKTTAPAPPSAITFTDDGSGTVALDFTDSSDGDIKQYEIYKVVSAVETFVGYGHNFRFTKPAAAVTYKVYAVNWSGFRSSTLTSPQATYSPTTPPAVTIDQETATWTTDASGNRVGNLLIYFKFNSYSPAITAQTALVFITRPSGSEELVDTAHMKVINGTYPPDGLSHYYGKAAIPIYKFGSYTIRVQTFDLIGNPGASSSVTFNVDATGTYTTDENWLTQLNPASLTLSYDSQVITGTVSKVSPSNVTYEVATTATFDPGTFVLQGPGNTFQVVPTSTGTKQYWARVKDNQGKFSAAAATNTVNVTAPADPTGYGLSFVDGQYVNHRASGVIAGMDYQFATANNGTGILTRARGGAFDELLASFSSRTITRYIRAINQGGITSNWVQAQITVAAPGAPTLALQQGYPSSSIITLTPVSTTRTNVLRTVIEMASDAGFTTILTTATESGCHLSTEVFGRAATQANVYVRARYEDAFTSTLSDGANSANLPVTFSNWASDDIISLKADKVIARTGDFFIIFADKVGSRNFVQAGSQTAQAEPVTWDANSLLGGTLDQTTQLFTKTASTGWGNCYVKGSRAAHHGDCLMQWTITAGGYRQTGLAYGSGGTTFSDFEHAFQYSTVVGDLYWVEGVTSSSALSGGAQVGDILTISIVGSNVIYARTRGGVTTIFTTRAATTKRALRPCVAVNVNGAVTDLPTVTAIQSSATGDKAVWQNIVGMGFDSSDDISKSRLTSAYDSGASSLGPLSGLAASQDGRFTFIASQLSASLETNVGWSVTDPDQLQSSILFGVATYNGTIYKNIAGVVTTTGVTYALNDEISVGRENGIWIIRKNGVVVYTGAVASTSALIVDTSFYYQNSALKTLRIFKCGALGQGWQNDPAGNSYMAGKLYLGEKGVSANEVVTRGVNSFLANGMYSGPDRYTFLPHKITSASVYHWFYNDDGTDTVQVQIGVSFLNKLTDTYANAASMLFCQCRVLNQFGEQVADFGTQTFNGDGVCAYGRHPRRYADPELQAVYALRFFNAFGWNAEAYVKAGVYTTAPPTYARRIDTGFELTGSGSDENGTAFPGFELAVQDTTIYSTNFYDYYWRRPGEAWHAWVSTSAHNRSIACSAQHPPDTILEFVTRNSDTLVYSNVLRLRTGKNNPAGAKIAPTGVSLQLNQAGTSVKVRWNLQANPTNSFDVWRVDVSGTATKLTAGLANNVRTYTDATISRGNTYWYVVSANYAAFTDAFSQGVRIDTPPSANAADPTNLAGVAYNPTQINWTWNLNSAVGAVSFDYKAVSTGDDPTSDTFWSSGVTTVPKSAGSTSHPLSGLTPNTLYAAQVRVADAGTTHSNRVSVRTPKTDSTGYY